MLLSSWIEYWQREFLNEDRKKSTVELYQSVLRVRVLPNIVNIRLDELTHLWARNWLRTVTDGLAPDTVKLTKAVLHRVLADAVSFDLLPSGNPFTGVRVAGAKRSRKGARDRFTPRQMREIVADLDSWIASAPTARHKSRQRLRDAIVIYAVAGPRRAELMGVTVGALHWGVNNTTVTITVEQQIDVHGAVVDLKTNEAGHREITISDTLALEVLKRRSVGKKPTDYLFEAGKPNLRWLPTNVGRDFRLFRTWRAEQETPPTTYKLALLTPHILRHTAAANTRAVLGLEAAQALCGHASIATTETYYAPPSKHASAASIFS
jgi:integrase